MISTFHFWERHMILNCRLGFDLWLKISWSGVKEPELAILLYEMFRSFHPIWLIWGKYDLASNFISGNLAPSSLGKVLMKALHSQASPPQLILSLGLNLGLLNSDTYPWNKLDHHQRVHKLCLCRKTLMASVL